MGSVPVSAENAPAPPSVVELLQKAKNGDAAAMYAMGMTYYSEDANDPAMAREAIRWFSQAAKLGHIESKINLADLYLHGHGIPPNAVEGEKLTLELEKNHPSAYMYQKLGTIYLQDFPSQDYGRAQRYFQLGAAQGNAICQNGLGQIYAGGKGVPVDYVEAIKWYRLAVDQGLYYSQYNLGRIYRDGKGVAKDLGEAARLFKLSADQGYAPAEYALGNAYLNGQGVPKDPVEAFKWQKRAAEGGNRFAQNNYGYMLLNGLGTEKNEAEGWLWVEKAAAQGETHAIAKIKAREAAKVK